MSSIFKARRRIGLPKAFDGVIIYSAFAYIKTTTDYTDCMDYSLMTAAEAAIVMDFTDSLRLPHRGFSRCHPINHFSN